MNNLAPAISRPGESAMQSRPTRRCSIGCRRLHADPARKYFLVRRFGEENEYLLERALRQNVLIKLNQRNSRLLPASLEPERRRARRAVHPHLHADEGRSRARRTTGPSPAETYAKLHGMLEGAMRGRTMFVVPYIMGPPDSPLTKVGVEITDSIYVVLSMRIMTRMGAGRAQRLGD